jgi:hypothetical protein
VVGGVTYTCIHTLRASNYRSWLYEIPEVGYSPVTDDISLFHDQIETN